MGRAATVCAERNENYGVRARATLNDCAEISFVVFVEKCTGIYVISQESWISDFIYSSNYMIMWLNIRESFRPSSNCKLLLSMIFLLTKRLIMTL